MAVLLMRLSAPLQSWGSRSRFTERDTEAFPTRSGISGLICAALGRKRDENMDDLNSLSMAVRVDKPGKMLKDYHTALHVIKASGSPNKNAVVSNRYYLADAKFLVGLEGDTALLGKIEKAISAPRWFLFLGRKSCPPGEPVYIPDALFPEGELMDEISKFPMLCESEEERLIVYREKSGLGAARVRDVPDSFSERTFSYRDISTMLIEKPGEMLCI